MAAAEAGLVLHKDPREVARTMSLPAVRLVLARAAAAEAGRLALAGQLQSLGAAAAAGSTKAAGHLTDLLRELADVADPTPAEDPARLGAELAAVFGGLGIPSQGPN